MTIKEITIERLDLFNEWGDLIEKMFQEGNVNLLEEKFLVQWCEKEKLLNKEMEEATLEMKSEDFIDDDASWASGLDLLNRCIKHYQNFSNAYFNAHFSKTPHYKKEFKVPPTIH